MDLDEGFEDPAPMTIGAAMAISKPSERFKRGEGCPCCKWGADAPEKQSLRGEAMGAMAELLGDDIDGMASIMDDFEYMGMLDE
jgi:hypothetical protein